MGLSLSGNEATWWPSDRADLRRVGLEGEGLRTAAAQLLTTVGRGHWIGVAVPAGADVLAFDAVGGARIWTAERVLANGADVVVLAAHRTWLLATGERAASICDTRTGRVLCISRREAPWRLGGAHLTDEGLTVLYHRKLAVEAGTDATSQATAAAVVERFAVPRGLTSRSADGSVRSLALRKTETQRLADPGDVQRVLWGRKYVYVVGKNTVRAYTLP